MKVIIEQQNKTHEYERGAVTFFADSPEARGQVRIAPCVYGLDIYMPAIGKEAVAFIDLWPCSEEAAEEGVAPGYPKLYIYDQESNIAIARINFDPDGTEVITGDAV